MDSTDEAMFESPLGSVYTAQSSDGCDKPESTSPLDQECMSCNSAASASSTCELDALRIGETTELADSTRHVNETARPTNITVEQQEECRCHSLYLSTTQACTGITAAQRAGVVDNMILSSARIGLSNDVLFRAVACFDRYLAAKPAPLNLLQPVGIACLRVSAKFEHVISPSAARYSELIYGSTGIPLGSAPAAKHLLVLLEESVLKALDYRLANIVTAKEFKHQYMQQLSSSPEGVRLTAQQLDQLYCMTSYLTEIALLEYQLLPWTSSQVAAAAYAYSHVLLGLRLDTDYMQQLTNHGAEEVQETMEFLDAIHTTLYVALQLGKPYAVTVKYLHASVGCVAAVAPVSSICTMSTTTH